MTEEEAIVAMRRAGVSEEAIQRWQRLPSSLAMPAAEFVIANPPAPMLDLPIRLTLPWSALCSDNAKYSPAYGKQQPRIILTAEYREAKRKTHWKAREAMTVGETRFPPLTGHLRATVRIYTPDARRHDVVNFGKALFDGMEKVIYADDAQLRDVRILNAGVDVDAPRAEIEISPL